MAYNDKSVNWFGQIGGGGGRSTQPRPQVSAPTISQIPGLNKAAATGSSLAEEPPRQIFRDTDSAYVRLAKQGGRTDLLRMDAEPAMPDSRPDPRPLPEWLQHGSRPNERNDDFSYRGDDFMNGRNTDLQDVQPNSPRDSRYSGYDWPEKMVPEGRREQWQTDSQLAYPATWQGDHFLQSENMPPASRIGPGGGGSPPTAGMRSGNNSRPDWLQPSPLVPERKDLHYESGRQTEEPQEARISPMRGGGGGVGQTGYGSQKPYADHGQEMPMSTETSSAFSQKNFQTPTYGDRQFSSKRSEDGYGLSSYQMTPQQQASSTAAAAAQQSNAYRMKRSDSMSKLLSFGYLQDRENESLNRRTPSQPKLDSGFTPNTYTTEYKAKMHSSGGPNAQNSQNNNSQSGYVPTLIADPSHRRRKQSIEERPDFFRIGSSDSQSLLSHASRRSSAEVKPDIFGNEGILGSSNVTYGKTRREMEPKPDFFKIGSLDNYLEQHAEQPKPNEAGILDKLNGYGLPPKTNFRRRKTEFQGPPLTTPVKAVSRF